MHISNDKKLYENLKNSKDTNYNYEFMHPPDQKAIKIGPNPTKIELPTISYTKNLMEEIESTKKSI